MLAGPPLLHCVHSRAGAQVAVRVLAQGTAKQRKKVIKAMKGVLPAPLKVIREVRCAGVQVCSRSWCTHVETCDLSRACEGHGDGRVGAHCAHCSTGLHGRHRSALKEYCARDCGEHLHLFGHLLPNLAACDLPETLVVVSPASKKHSVCVDSAIHVCRLCYRRWWFTSMVTACCCSWLHRLACRLMLQLSCTQRAALRPLLPRLLRLLKQQVMAMRRVHLCTHS